MSDVIQANVEFLQNNPLVELVSESRVSASKQYLTSYLVLMLDKEDGHFLKVAHAIYDLPNMVATRVCVHSSLETGSIQSIVFDGELSEELSPAIRDVIEKSLRVFNKKITSS